MTLADVKWIKITTDMFDNRKIRHLRKLPDGNNIVLIWVMLLTMAGRCNSGGMIFLTENIPYTPKMLADELDFEETTVQLALNALERFNMIITNQGFFSIAGWDEYQNIEGMDKIREQNRIRQQKRREKAKQSLIGSGNVCEYCGKAGATIDHIVPKTSGGLDLPENTVCSCLSCNMKKTNRRVDVFLNEMLLTNPDFELDRIISNEKIMKYVIFDDAISRFVSRDVTLHVTECHATEEEIEKEIEQDSDIKKESITCQQIVDLYHSICKSFPSVRSISAARQQAIKARLNTYSLDDFRTVFENAEASSFLKGANDRNWSATFDWLLKDQNMAKVLEGNYADKPARTGGFGRKEVVPDWMKKGEPSDFAMSAIKRTMSMADNPELSDRVERLKKELQGG